MFREMRTKAAGIALVWIAVSSQGTVAFSVGANGGEKWNTSSCGTRSAASVIDYLNGQVAAARTASLVNFQTYATLHEQCGMLSLLDKIQKLCPLDAQGLRAQLARELNMIKGMSMGPGSLVMGNDRGSPIASKTNCPSIYNQVKGWLEKYSSEFVSDSFPCIKGTLSASDSQCRTMSGASSGGGDSNNSNSGGGGYLGNGPKK